MPEPTQDHAQLLKKAWLEIRRLRARIEERVEDPIAIVGLGCRFPGGANDPDSYWRMLAKGTDAIVDVPADRWNAGDYYDPDPDSAGKMSTRWGGFLDVPVDRFDAAFFRISPREANSLDPQHRLLLEVVWEALENAGQNPAALAGARCAFYTGISTSEYHRIITDNGGAAALDGYTAIGNALSAAAGRISHFLRINGPSMSIDTACSSSLVAVHLACQSLQRRESSLALACGVNLMLTPETTIAFSRSRMMSRTGRCHTFDAAADGYVRGEGCGVVVLKRLADAERDGDQVLAVIRGTAVNHDGPSGGITVPNGNAQQALLREALERAAMEPSRIGYVECHGTGTPLGDPIETRALGMVLAPQGVLDHPVYVGSVKTNIGHLEAASGIAGLIKTVLTLRNRTIPPHLHLRELNPHIHEAGFPFQIPLEPVEWTAGDKPRVASVSSFGFTGTNACVMLEEAPARASAPVDDGSPQLLVLSARSHPALADLAQAYSRFLEQHPDISLRDICYTAACGRSHFTSRMAVQANSHEEMRRKLDAAITPTDPVAIAYVSGEDIDWATYYAGENRRKVALPTYPFQRERHWAENLTPLLGRRVLSALAETQFQSEIGTRNLPWLSDHRVYGQIVFPGAGYVEMALRAAEQLNGLGPHELRDLALLEPLVLPDGETRTVQLIARQTDDAIGFELFSREGDVWRKHVTGTIGPNPEPQASRVALEELQAHCAEEIPAADFYAELRRYGLEYGPGFQGLTRLWRGDNEALGQLSPSLNTIILDCAFQLLGACANQGSNERDAWLPMAMERVSWHAPERPARWAHAAMRAGSQADTRIGDVRLFDENGVVVAEVHGIRARRATRSNNDWFFEIEWRQLDLDAVLPADFLAAPKDIAAIVASDLETLAREFGLDAIGEVPAELERLSLIYASAALRKVNAADVVPRYERLFRRLRQMVAEESPVCADPVVLMQRYPQCEAEFTLLSRCGEKLAEALTGQVQGIDLLFPGGSTETAEKLYKESPGSRLFNELTARAIAEAIAALPAGRKLRIVEIGAGTGGTTAWILDRLPADRVEYCFTDIGVLFTAQAKEKFAKYPFLTYAQLDIEKDPREQGFPRFDIAIGANVLHATADLNQTLTNVKRLLAPEGLLVLLEATKKQRWLDLVFGLMDGWWRFEDTELRPDYPLLSEQQWAALLEQKGLREATAIGGDGQSVIISRNTAEAEADDRNVIFRVETDRNHGPGEMVAAQERGIRDLLSLVQSLARRESPPRLWLVTDGSVTQSPIHGIGKVIAIEHPELRCTRVEIDGATDNELLQRELDNPTDEDHIAYRNGVRYVARLTRSIAPKTPKPAAIRNDGAYLIAGGFGGLGLLTAQWLVDHGAKELALTGRSEPSDYAEQKIREWRQAGVTVRAAQADVSRFEDMKRVIEGLLLPLRGVIHSAGVLNDGVLLEQTWERFEQVMAPKVEGAWNLHLLTKDLPLDFFVLYSSAASIFGSAAQANHAAANAFLDSLARHRKAAGLPALSINWGAWSEVGSAATQQVETRLALHGLGTIPSRQGIEAFEKVLNSGRPQVAVVPIDWPRFNAQFAGPETPRFLSELLTRKPAAEVRQGPVDSDLLKQLKNAPANSRRAVLMQALERHAAKVLGMGAGKTVDAGQPLSDLGMDSLMAVELRNTLGLLVGRTLPATLLFDYPTLEAIAGYLEREVLVFAEPVEAVRSRDEVRHSAREPIAIVGLGCRFPGAPNPDAFRKLLHEGVDAVGEVPPGRWDVDAYYDPDPNAPGKIDARRGGFLGPVDKFDAGFFGIAAREAVQMDPQHRLLLEVAWEALEHAGQAPRSLSGTQTGVFIGIGSNDYSAMFRGSENLDAYVAMGNSFSMSAGRLSYVLGLQGPAMAVDTACSSSLVSLHLACQSLRAGECRVALAGGVNLILTPEVMVSLSKARMLSPDGRCKTFDASANGFARGEGCGIVVLKRLKDAEADGDRILAVVRGSAVNQDGRSNGITAPNGPAQEAVIRRALSEAGIEPNDLGYVEAHGTGTPLGDPIEVQALGRVLGRDREPLPIGSVKTNIGHLEAAAGIAGLIKVVLSLQHEEIPPHLHFERRNPHIAWDETAVRIPVKAEAWPRNGRRRIAGVSSFGFSGTNAHVVIEEAPRVEAPAQVDPPPHILTLSAKTPEALRELAAAYAAHTEALADITFTANACRSPWPYRLALIADTTDEAREKLSGYLAGDPSGVFTGHAPAPPKIAFLFKGTGPFALEHSQAELWRRWGVEPSAVSGEGAGEHVAACVAGVFSVEDALKDAEEIVRQKPCIEIVSAGEARGFECCIEIGPETSDRRRTIETLAQLYVSGADIRWAEFHGPGHRKVSLPTYPFQRQRYWAHAEPVKRHPAPVQNDSLYEVRWEKTTLPDARSGTQQGPWLLLADESDTATQLQRLLERRGEVCTPSLDNARRVVSLRGDALEVIQQISRIADPPQFTLVTRGSQTIGDVLADPDQAAVWLIGRVASLEHPEFCRGLIDLDQAATAEASAALLFQALTTTTEDQIAFRSGECFVPRLQRCEALSKAVEPLRLRADATYWITGGIGGLGLETAQWMVAQGARNLVLLDIAEPSASVQAAVADMERQGAHIVVTRTDVSDAAQLDKVLAIEGLPQLRGVVHCAGILDDGAITGQTRERFARVFAPKAQGAWNLHLLTRRMPLDFFVLYSSVTSIFGSPGQANYAAANAYLDALAHVRRREGLPAISINWGPWADVGMAARLERRMSYVNLYGVSSIQPAEGVAAFGEIVARNPAQVTFLQLDIAALVESMPVVLDSPFYSALTAGYAATAAAETSEIFAQLLAAAQGDRSDIALAYLRTALAQIVGAPEDLFTPESNLLELGLDSLMAMDLINGIKRDLRVTLYPREFYQRPFTGQLAEYLAQEFEIANRATADSPAPIEPGIEVAWPTVAIAPAVVTHRNPPAVFLLSSPRSGSTLLRVMLAGHPQLFCPPELHLLPFADMKHRSAMLGSSWMDEGFQRALMELTGGSVEQSRSTIAAMEERGASTQDAYLLLQDLAQGKLLVDKSPTYAGSPEALARAEALFEKPKYIHLVRHPYAVIESFARMRMHRLIGMDHADPWRLAEQIWSASNRNLDAFFEGVDPARRHKIRYEDLVSEPERCMRALCEFLEIPWDAALLSPYEGPRMTDGLHAQSLGVGDPGFRNHTQIDASLSDVWRKVRLPAPLGELARTTARELGYELPKTAAASRSVSSPSFGELPRESFADVGSLRLCVCEWGPQDGVPILCLHGILDQAAVWGPVASRLASQGYRVIAPDLRGHGRSQHAPTPNSYQLLDVLSDLDGLTTQLFDEPFTLVGHSMGAALAAVFAAVRSPKVASLVLVEPGVVLDAPERDPADLLAVQLDYLASPPVHPVFADLEVAAERLRQVTPALSREFAMHLAGRATEPYGKGFRWRWDPPLRTRSSLDMGMDQFRRLLGRISAPTVLVRGVKSDFLSPENAKLLLKAIAGSREATADGGHYLPVETPEALAEWIADAAAAEALRRTAVAGIGLG